MINETYSAFVQGFMPSLARPEVDVLEGLTTAIIVDQERMGANPRSTVGTATDANAMLRILFSRVGTAAHRPADGLRLQRADPHRQRRDEDREGRPRGEVGRPQRRLPGRHVPPVRGHGQRQRLRPDRAVRRVEVAAGGCADGARLQHGRLVRPDLQRRRAADGQADRDSTPRRSWTSSSTPSRPRSRSRGSTSPTRAWSRRSRSRSSPRTSTRCSRTCGGSWSARSRSRPAPTARAPG